VAAAAYRSGERLAYNGHTHDYTQRGDIIKTEIILPENAPPEFSDRETLWCAVEKAEDCSTRRMAARTAREIVLALPRELTFESSVALVREFVIETFVRKGMCADIAIHRGESKDSNSPEADHLQLPPHNPHAHVLLTTRTVGPDGFGLKNRDWDKKSALMEWRQRWADVQNRTFARKGLPARVDHRSYKDRGINREPTVHLGPKVAAMERRGIQTKRGDKNRNITARNQRQERLEGPSPA